MMQTEFGIAKTVLFLGAFLSTSCVSATAQNTLAPSHTSQEGMTDIRQPTSVDCMTDQVSGDMAQSLLEQASEHLINKRLDEFGGGKRLRVKMRRCETVRYHSEDAHEYSTFDVSYELTWRKNKNLVGGEKYFMDLEAELSGDGSWAAFSVLNASYKLNNRLVESFPIEIKYFYTTKD